jgi:hypothetical protein
MSIPEVASAQRNGTLTNDHGAKIAMAIQKIQIDR